MAEDQVLEIKKLRNSISVLLEGKMRIQIN